MVERLHLNSGVDILNSFKLAVEIIGIDNFKDDEVYYGNIYKEAIRNLKNDNGGGMIGLKYKIAPNDNGFYMEGVQRTLYDVETKYGVTLGNITSIVENEEFQSNLNSQFKAKAIDIKGFFK